jgi:hypothetical protein
MNARAFFCPLNLGRPIRCFIQSAIHIMFPCLSSAREERLLTRQWMYFRSHPAIVSETTRLKIKSNSFQFDGKQSMKVVCQLQQCPPQIPGSITTVLNGFQHQTCESIADTHGEVRIYTNSLHWEAVCFCSYYVKIQQDPAVNEAQTGVWTSDITADRNCHFYE